MGGLEEVSRERSGDDGYKDWKRVLAHQKKAR